MARRYLGVPYKWGGTTTRGLDCSGYTLIVYRQVGVYLPRISYQQAHVGRRVPSLQQALPGDLLFYYYNRRIRHVAIYAGHGLMYEAPRQGFRVRLTAVRDPHLIRSVL